jgi:hypothetical protein
MAASIASFVGSFRGNDGLASVRHPTWVRFLSVSEATIFLGSSGLFSQHNFLRQIQRLLEEKFGRHL